MGKKKKSAYAQAGVDIDAAEEAVNRMKDHIQSTLTPSVLSRVGSFGGAFNASFLKDMMSPSSFQVLTALAPK